MNPWLSENLATEETTEKRTYESIEKRALGQKYSSTPQQIDQKGREFRKPSR